MADSSEGSKTGVPAAAAVLETIKKAIDSLKPSEADIGATKDKTSEPPKPGSNTAPPFVPAGLDDMASAAVQRYRSTIRWMLGAFGAVAVAVFGSLPFTNVSQATGDDRTWILVGLAAAAVGIALAVYAVSIVAEPVDASLGELAADIEPVPTNFWNVPINVRRFVLGTILGLVLGAIVGAIVGVVRAGDGITLQPVGGEAVIGALVGVALLGLAWVARQKRAWDPRWRATEELRTILHGDVAHLGPGTGQPPSVRGLIGTLGAQAASRYTVARLVARAEVETATVAKLVEEDDAAVARWWDRTKDLGTPLGTDDRERRRRGGQFALAHAALAAGSAERNRQRLRDARASESALRKQLAYLDAQLAVHLAHRDLVLTESGVAQLRGVFRLGRIVLIAGILLTAVGASIYALHLPDSDSGDDTDPVTSSTTAVASVQYRTAAPSDVAGTPVRMTLKAGLPTPVEACAGQALTGVAIGGYDAAKVATVAVVAPNPCIGIWSIPPGTADVTTYD